MSWRSAVRQSACILRRWSVDNILYDVTSTQPVADMLKTLVNSVPTEGKQSVFMRDAALKAISQFEEYPWQPVLFEEAIYGYAAGIFTFTDQVDYEVPDWVTPLAAPRRLARDVFDVLTAYMMAVKP